MAREEETATTTTTTALIIIPWWESQVMSLIYAGWIERVGGSGGVTHAQFRVTHT